MAGYERLTLNSIFPVENLYTLFYFELSKTFFTRGEAHDFWEFVYVDKGELMVTADGNSFLLSAGSAAFHHPNQFHIVKANGIIAPNILVVTFDCKSSYADFFSNKTFILDDTEKKYLSDIAKAGTSAFYWQEDKPDGQADDTRLEHGRLLRQSGAPIEDEQIVKATLELFLLHLYQRTKRQSSVRDFNKTTNIKSAGELSGSIISYLEAHLAQTVTLREISLYFNVSPSKMKKAFRLQTGDSIIDCLIHLRIKEAKRLIRETSLNFTQISEKVGFSSIHHFSNTFKKKTGMTPTEYSLSIKSHGRVDID